MEIKSLIKEKNAQYVLLIKSSYDDEKVIVDKFQSVLEKIKFKTEEFDSQIVQIEQELQKKQKQLQERMDLEIEATHQGKLKNLKALYLHQLQDNEEEHRTNLFVINNAKQVNLQYSTISSNIEHKELENQIQNYIEKKRRTEQTIEDELKKHKQRLLQNFDYSSIFSCEIEENEELLFVVKRYYETIVDLARTNGSFVSAEIVDELMYAKRQEEEMARYLASKTEIEETYKKLVAVEKKRYLLEKERFLALREKKLTGEIDVSDYVKRIKAEQSIKIEELKRDFASFAEQVESNAREEIRIIKEKKTQTLRELEQKKDALTQDLNRTKEEHKNKINSFLKKVKDEIDSLLNTSFNYNVGTNDLIKVDSLPEQICIGKFTSPIEDCELTKILYGNRWIGCQNPIFINIRENGNIIINSSIEDETNESLYRFVCGLTLKYMEEFPLGSLRVHFVDVNQHIWFNKFINAFLREDKNPISKQLITNDSKIYSKIEAINNNDCESIIQRTIGEINSLFDLYQVDKTYPFHLFVIRSGFGEIVENGNIEYLRLIKNLLSDRGIKCGVRFIIVNDYKENDRIDSRKKQLLDEILRKAMLLDFNNNKILLNGSEITVSSIEEEDGGSFIERRSLYMAEILSGKQLDKILYEDIGFNNYQITNKYSSVISIPVGKLGNQVLEIPFNCGSEKDGPANSGYIALGRTSSGKSSFFHSLVINGCMKYSPDDVQFWLLDFKNGGASSNYEKANIPHIKLLSKKNKIDDAYCLLNLLHAEMDRRGDLLNEVGKKCRGTNFQDLNEYNQYIDKNIKLGSHLSRIIVVIDEAQEMFMALTEDNEDIKKIAELIATIAVRSRYVGIHMVMIAQNLTIGRSQILKDSFVGNIKGKVTFGIDEGFLRESGFGQAFFDNVEEIKCLRQGEAFLTCNDTKPDKVRIAYCAPVDFEKYFTAIRNKYNLFECNMTIIGNNAPLLPQEKAVDNDVSYETLLREPIEKEIRGEKVYGLVYGEDAYSLAPTKFVLNATMSNIVAIGTDNRMMASICRSILIGVDNLQRKKIYVCNGAGNREPIFNAALNNCASSKSELKKYKLSDIDMLVREVYYEFDRRQKLKEEEIKEDYPPIFVIVNDIFSIRKIKGNIIFEACTVKESKDVNTESLIEDIEDIDNLISELNNIADEELSSINEEVLDNNTINDILNGREIWNVIQEICIDGASVGIYFNFSSKNVGSYCLEEIFKQTANKIIFNDFIGALSYSNFPSYIICSMLNGLRNEFEKGETMAVSIINGVVSKVRPIIFIDKDKEIEKQ